MPGSRIQHRRLGPEQIGYIADAGFIPVLRDSQALFGFRDRCLGNVDALRGGVQVGISPMDLQPDGGIRPRLFRRAALLRKLAFLDPRLVAEAVEEVPAQADGHQPVIASPGDESLAIRFKSAVQGHLREQAAAGIGGLRIRQTGRELHLARLRPLLDRTLLLIRQRSFGKS